MILPCDRHLFAPSDCQMRSRSDRISLKRAFKIVREKGRHAPPEGAVNQLSNHSYVQQGGGGIFAAVREGQKLVKIK